MILSLMIAVCAQAPAAPRIADPAEQLSFNQAQRALDADVGLLDLHRGFRAYISADDALRQAEEGFDALMELSTLRERVEDFEEVLIADTDARTDFARMVTRLGRDPALRAALDELNIVEATPRPARDLDRSFAYLRAHPDAAIPFLMRRGATSAAIQALRPLHDAFTRDKLFQTQVREAWTRLDALAGAREAIYPWWARIYGGSSAAAQRYHDLESELRARPSLRRAWEAREMAWATRPEAVGWRDHLYARMRRDPVLAPIYFDYLHTLRTLPEADIYAEQVFTAMRGAAPAWPPQGSPPTLAAWNRQELITRPGAPHRPASPSPDATGVERPKSPTIQRPSAPTKPLAPERAQEPAAPPNTPKF